MRKNRKAPLHHRRPFVRPKPRPSRKKRVLVGLVGALAITSVAGVIERGREAK